MDVGSMFERSVSRTPDRDAVVDVATGERHTYEELAAEVESVAAELVDRGIGPGARPFQSVVVPSLAVGRGRIGAKSPGWAESAPLPTDLERVPVPVERATSPSSVGRWNRRSPGVSPVASRIYGGPGPSPGNDAGS